VIGRLCLVAATALLLVAAPATAGRQALPPPVDPCGLSTTCVHVELGFYGSAEASDGSGTVTSSPAGLNCRYVRNVTTGVCDIYLHSFGDSLTVTLIPQPDAGSQIELGCGTSIPCDRTFAASPAAGR
jgi:hypothetical protein